MNAISQVLMPPLLSRALENRPVVLADVGAAGGIHERWSMLDQHLRVLGFEPDRRAFDGLPKQSNRVWVNAALTDHEGEAKLLVTNHQTNTSLLPANRPIIDRIYQDPSDFNVIKEVVVPCTTLDRVSLIENLEITALKADTQGTELSILQGAEKCLQKSLMVVELEVEFTQLYSNQPLFAEVDLFMREHGFVLFDIGNLLYHKWRNSSHVGGRKGQLLAADALYFRAPESLVEISKNNEECIQLLAQYWAVCTVYGYTDLAFEVARESAGKGWISSDMMKSIDAWVDSNSRQPILPKLRGRGRAASWMRKFADQVDAKHHSYWINPLGNI